MRTKKVKSKPMRVTINGMVAVDNSIDQFRDVRRAEKKTGHKLAYLGDWDGWSIYVPYGSAPMVAKETAMVTFNQTLTDLGFGRQYVWPESSKVRSY
jgi:hypothetical protein